MITQQALKFKDGEATIYDGRKPLATIIDRAVFYETKRIKSSYSPQYPYSVTIKGVGMRECETLSEAIMYANKYTAF